MKEKTGIITKVSGPLVVAEGMTEAKMFDVVEVSEGRLIGEIIEMRGDKASIQVYEDTAGLGPGEKVYLTGNPLSVELGPGLLTNFYDGIQRPLRLLEEASGPFISRGISVPGLNREKKWEFKPRVKQGDEVSEGDILGEVEEVKAIGRSFRALAACIFAFHAVLRVSPRVLRALGPLSLCRPFSPGQPRIVRGPRSALRRL